MQSLIDSAAALRAEYYQPPVFNLFTLLRSASDEVRLHSRFLAFLLDPEEVHGAGSQLLEVFLETLGIEGFDCRSASVRLEYRNIDILVRNGKGQAIIIENKIHAEDQPEQLQRYMAIMEGEGYSVFEPLYLTLDGREADPASCGDVVCKAIGYASDILPWLERCLTLVIREAGVRESLLQYIDLVKKLTFNDQGHRYMDMLKQALMKNNNLLLVKDLQKAYDEVLKDLQWLLWEAVARQIARKYEKLPAPYCVPERAQVERYYSKSPGRKYFGLYYQFDFMPGAVYIELNHNFYCGYYCDASSHPAEYKLLQKMTERLNYDGISDQCKLLWRFTTELDMNSPSDKDLIILNDPEKREEIAERMADDLYDLWTEAHEFYRQSKLAR